MTNVGTWTAEKYGPRHDQVVYVETSVSGTDLPWIMYCSGGGWQRASELFWFDSAAGEPIWLDQIHPNLGTYPVKAFVCSYPRRRHDWGTANTNDITTQQLGKYATTPSFRGAGTRGVQRCFQHIRNNWERFGINPNAGATMGASAGGQHVGAAAYAPSASYYGRAHPANATRRFPVRTRSKPCAVHLRITPTKMSYFKERSIHGAALYGAPTQEDYDAIDDLTKDSLSPVTIGQAHRQLVPTFYYSNESLSATAAQDPPWQVATVTYNAGTTYAAGDRVRQASSNWYSLHGGNLGNTPSSSPSDWEEYADTPYHHPIQGKVLKEELFDGSGFEFIFAHPDSGHTYPDDAYDWLKIQWDRAIATS